MNTRFSDLKTLYNKGDIVQIISEHLNGGIGRIKEILPAFVIVGPHKDDELEKQYGPGVLFTTAIPIEEIKLVLTIVPITNAEINTETEKGGTSDDSA